ncbi:MAG TPA: PAS domain S-box protein [Anaerolineales bacterium]
MEPKKRSVFMSLLHSQSSVEHFEARNYRKDGSIIWTSTSARAVRDQQGNVQYYEGFVQDVTQHKRAEQALSASQARYQNLVETSHDLIWSVDAEGRLTFLNRAAKEIYGYEPEELIGRSFFDLMDPDTFQSPQSGAFEEQIGESRQFNGVETRIRHRDGRQMILSANSVVLRDWDGKLTGVVGTSRDITERKKTEERLNDLLAFNEKILNYSSIGILTYKLTGECVFANENAASIVGTNIEKLKNQNFHTIQSWRKSGLYDLVLKAITSQTEVKADVHHLSTYGKDIWMTVHCVTFRSKEEDHVLLSILDMTEQRQAEEKLQQSESRYRLATQATNDVIWEWTAATNQLLWSENARHVFGYSEEEIGPHAKWWDDRLHPDDRNSVLTKLNALIAGNESIWLEEYRFLRKDGSYAYISDRGYIERAKNGAPVRMIGAMSDITARKETEIERQALLEIMQGLANTKDLQELLALVHRSIARAIYAENFFVVLHQGGTGLFEEIYSVDQYDPPASPSKLENSITAYVFRTGEPLLLTQDLFAKLATKGEVKLVGTDSASWLGVPLKTSGRTIGVMAVQDYENENRYSERDRDFLASIAAQIALVIERRRADYELQQKNDDLGLLNAINAAVVRGQDLDSIVELLAKELSRIFSTQGSTIYSTIYMLTPDKESIRLQKYFFSADMERRIEKLIGSAIPIVEIPMKEGGYFHRVMASRQSAITSEPAEIRKWIAQFAETRFLPPLARAIIQKLIPQIHKLLNINSTIIVPLISEEETIGFLDISGSCQFTVHDQRRIENIAGQLTAIIQRQQATEKLRASEERFRLLFENSGEAVLMTQPDGAISSANPEACRIFDRSEPEIRALGVAGIMDPNDARWQLALGERARSGQFRGELNFLRKNGSSFPGELSTTIFRDSSGNEKTSMIIRDISERKRAEEALTLFRSQIDHINDTIEVIDMETGRFIDVNEQACRIHGYTREEYLMLTIDEIDPLEATRTGEKLLRSGSLVFESLHRRKDGSTFPVEVNLNHIRLDRDYNLAVVRDITERKRAEQALRESEEQYRAIFEGVQDAIFVQSLDGKILMVNERACEMFGYSQAEFLTKTVADLVPPGHNIMWANGTEASLSAEPRETVNQRANGEIFPIEISGRVQVINGEQVLLVVVRDIAERKQAEQELKRSHSLLHATLESTADGILVVEADGRISNFNQKFLELWRIPPSLAAQKNDRVLLEFILNQLKNPSVFLSRVEALYRSPEETSFDELEFRDGRIFERYSQPQQLGDAVLGRVWSFRDVTERKRAEAAEHEQHVLAEALRDTAETLSSTLDYGEVLDHILAAVGRVVPHDAATIMLIEAGSAHVVRSHGYDQHGFNEEIMGIRLPLDETPNLQQMLESRQPVIVYDTYAYSGWKRMESTDWLRSNVGAPISIYGEAIGFICLDSQTPQYFTPVHAERLEAFANQAALAIHNARLLKQAQEEIAERKQAEEELRASEERFRQLADNIQEAFWMTDAQTGQEIYMSPAIEKIWGQPIEQLMHEPGAFINSVFPEDRPAMLEALHKEKRGENVEIEYRIVQPDGSVRWIWDRAFPVSDDSGKVQRIAGIAADITERKRAEEALRESENKAKALLNALPDLMFRLDRQGTILDYKADRSELYAQSEPTLQKKKIREIAPPEFGNLIEHYILQALETRQMQVFEYRLLIPERGPRDYEARMVTSGNDEVIAIVRDITEHKRNEAETQRRADEFAALYKTARDLTAQYDLPTLLNTIVERACTLLSAPGGGVYLYDEAHAELEMVLSVGSPVQTGLRLKVGEGMAGRVALNRELLIVDDYHTWEGRSLHFETIPLRAVLEVPMLYGGQLIGVLVVQELGESERKFTEADAHLLALFAEYAASAVHAARLIEETRRGAAETSALLKTSLALTNLDLEATLQTIGNSAKALFTADGCRIFLMEPGDEYLRCVLALQENFAAFSNLRIKIGEGVTGAIASSGQAEIVNEMHNDPRGVQVPGTPDDEKEAIMFAPLKERDRTIGILSIRRAGAERPFQSTDLELLEAFASMTASAVSNARLFEETQRRLAELEALYENGLAVGRLLKPSEIGERIISTFARYLPWHHVTIRLRKENSDDLQLVAFNLPHLKEEERKDAELHFVARINKVGQGLSGWAIQTGIPLRTGNVHVHPQYIDTHAGIQSGLYMPLRVGERVIGVISVESEVENAFTEQDERLLATLANQTAIAFENARLYQSAQQELMERKRVEEELRESQERFQNLFERSPVATWLEDFSQVAAWLEQLRSQGVEDISEYLAANPEELKHGVGLIRILNVNHAAVIMNGAQSKEELIDIVHTLLKEDIPQRVMINEFEMIWRGCTSFGFEMSSHKLDGSTITGVQRFFIPIKDGVPDFARVIVTSTDISDRVNIEKELRASEAHYRALADSITDILIELDHDLRYTHWNKAYETLTGIAANDAIGKTPKELFGQAEEYDRIQRIYAEVLQTQQPKSFEMVLVVNGEKRLFESNAYPSTGGVSVVAKDVTDRRRSEVILQKRFEFMEYAGRHSLNELMQKAVDEVSELTDSPIGFFHFMEPDQTSLGMQTWSTNAFRLFPVPINEGSHLPVDQAGVWAEAVRKRRPMIQNDYNALTGKKGLPQGHVPILREMVIPIIRNERLVAVMGVGNKPQDYTSLDLDIATRLADYAWDVTERKQMEVALEVERNHLVQRVEERTADLSRANSNLARALRVKDEFLANMSHELRTPLNAILGLSESLGEQIAGPLNEKQQKYISTISESGHHLLSLINDILDLAKIDAGQITLDINKVDIRSVCQASLRMIKQLAQKKNQEVALEIDPGLGLMWADERRLKQMIVNLLGNAVKFTPENGKLGLQVQGDQEANQISFTVWDNGIGIKQEDLARLFQPFVQLDSGLARESTGTGLGLALVAQMARLHGGGVNAHSEAGKGSRFTIVLPWEPVMVMDSAARMRITGKFRAIQFNETNKPRILLVEDTKEVIMMLKDYLELAGYQVFTAQDGIDGIVQARHVKPDLILMDVQMARMDGIETTRKLRGDPNFRYTPIIALTALAMPQDRERCLAVGMDEYISKPVNLKALVKIIQSCLFEQRARSQ